MSSINPLLPVAAPKAEGVGWCVAVTEQGTAAWVLRDDGYTFIGAYIFRDAYNRATLITRLLASASITAGEIARINAAGAASNW